jgi:hypothetical protein
MMCLVSILVVLGFSLRRMVLKVLLQVGIHTPMARLIPAVCRVRLVTLTEAPGDRVLVVELIGAPPLTASIPSPDDKATGVPTVYMFLTPYNDGRVPEFGITTISAAQIHHVSVNVY